MRSERTAEEPKPAIRWPLVFRITPPWLGVPDRAQFAEEARRSAGREMESEPGLTVSDEEIVEALLSERDETLDRLYGIWLRRCG